MLASTFSGGDIWWMLTKERRAWCNLQVKLCDPCLSALRRCIKALYKYSSFPFFSFPYLSGIIMLLRRCTLIGIIEKLHTASSSQQHVKIWNKQTKGKVLPYSLPSDGPGADPSVQAVSPQVSLGCHCFVPGRRSSSTIPRPVPSYTAWCEQLAQGCYTAFVPVGIEPTTYWSQVQRLTTWQTAEKHNNRLKTWTHVPRNLLTGRGKTEGTAVGFNRLRDQGKSQKSSLVKCAEHSADLFPGIHSRPVAGSARFILANHWRRNVSSDGILQQVEFSNITSTAESTRVTSHYWQNQNPAPLIHA